MGQREAVCMQKEEPPLRDVFAAQWLIAVLIGLFFCGMQFFAPAFCGELLETLARIMRGSPSVETLLQRLADAAAAWYSA